MAPADASASTRPRRPPAAMASSAFADLLDEWMPWSAVTLSTACPGIGAGASCDHVGVGSAADGVIESYTLVKASVADAPHPPSRHRRDADPAPGRTSRSAVDVVAATRFEGSRARVDGEAGPSSAGSSRAPQSGTVSARCAHSLVWTTVEADPIHIYVGVRVDGFAVSVSCLVARPSICSSRNQCAQATPDLHHRRAIALRHNGSSAAAARVTGTRVEVAAAAMWGWLLSCARSGVRAGLRLSVVQLHAGRSLLDQRVKMLEALVLVFAAAALQQIAC